MATLSTSTTDERRLVLAFDVGTTYSGVAYRVLGPTGLPEIQNVQRYPGQSEGNGDSKIPSIIVYGPNGDVRAIGAEAEDEAMKEAIENENLFVSKWFKLHLRPQGLPTSQDFDGIPPLPPGKTIVRVLADMLRYLSNAARRYIVDTAFNGAQIWESKKDVILTHPNGWEGAQQAVMRQAAILAGLIPDTQEGRDSVRFVTEGEASLHYCVFNKIVPDTLKEDDKVLVVDAGGGTVDISGYQKKSNDEFLFEEVAPPECYFHGSIFVSEAAKAYLNESLRGSKYAKLTDYIAECFDKTTKVSFRTSSGPHFIRFGSMYDKDPSVNVQSGKVKLDGAQVARFFQPSIDCITKAIEVAFEKERIKTVCLVGGFAASDWLFQSLQTKFQGRGVSICRPPQNPGKAVASGAISSHLDHYVNARVSKFAFGTDCSTVFDPEDPEHLQRRSTLCLGVDGIPKISGCFSIILPKNIRVTETQEHRKKFFLVSRLKEAISLESEVLCYCGPLSAPKWVTDGLPSDWKVMCTIEAESSNLKNIAKERRSLFTRETFYTIEFEVILLFGHTEFKAQIAWVEEGQEKRGPAKIIYSDII